MSKFKEWQELKQLRGKADDWTQCPKCHDQLYFCDCIARLANEVLTELQLNEIIVGLMVRVDELEGLTEQFKTIADDRYYEGRIDAYRAVIDAFRRHGVGLGE